MFGSEQIVFGTDYPFGLGQEGKQYVEHAVGRMTPGWAKRTDEDILFNARDLLRLEF
jgi:hypothetical protein